MSLHCAQQKPKRKFYDDYEDDCIEIWDAIEDLQEKVAKLLKEKTG